MPRELQTEDDRNYAHLLTLLSVSAAMVGVCLTAVGLSTSSKCFKNGKAGSTTS